MAFITVPDQILEKNTCSECFRYLSVMPVKVYPNGETKCGRCSKDGDEGTKSMYETILKNALFPCINRYDGCNKLMESEMIEDHERTCLGDKSGSKHCPLCEFEHVTSYFIYRHILANHKDNVLDTNEVHLDFGCDLIKTFLYYENYLLFAISIRFSFEDKYIELGVTHFSPKYSKIAYKFQLFATGENAAIVRGTSVYKTQNEETKIIALLNNVSRITMKLNFSIPQNMPEYLIGKLISKKINVDTQTIEPPKIRNGDIGANVYGVMFEYEIKNIHEFLSKEKCHQLLSPIYFINETPIQVGVLIEPKVEDSFRVFLQIDRNKTLIKPWSRYAEVELTLVSTKLDITVKISKEFSSKQNWECVTFNKTFYEILDPKNGIIKDNSICVKFLGMITSV